MKGCSIGAYAQFALPGKQGLTLPMQVGREPELRHAEMLRTEPMDWPRRGTKGYGVLLIAGWVVTRLMDLVARLGRSNYKC